MHIKINLENLICKNGENYTFYSDKSIGFSGKILVYEFCFQFLKMKNLTFDINSLGNVFLACSNLKKKKKKKKKGGVNGTSAILNGM